MKTTNAGVKLGAYATEQAAALLGRFAFELRKTAKSTDPDAIHDLRVSIRRLTQCLKTFSQCFPAGGARKIRRRLRTLMDLSAEVRNRDIALVLVKQAGIPSESSLHRRLADERKQTEKELTVALNRWRKRELSRKWRLRLGLG
jgi:CHAD domain-containing protein